MSVDTDLRARLESLRIKIEWHDDVAHDRPTRLITIFSFSKRLLEYGAFLISSSAQTDPENHSVQATGGGYCLYYRQSPGSPLSRALCEDVACNEPAAVMKSVLTEETRLT